jgi:GAF domain-containing protein
MNWQILASSIAIYCGAIVMMLCIFRIQKTFQKVELIPEENRAPILGFLKTHRFLMVVFLIGYIVVATIYLLGVEFGGMLVVGAIFFLGAVFVLFGLLLQSRILSGFESRVHAYQEIVENNQLQTPNWEKIRQQTIESRQPVKYQSKLGRIWGFFVEAHNSIEDVGKQRQARLVSSMLFASACLSAVRIIIAFFNGSYLTDTTVPVFVVMVLTLFAAYGISRTRFYRYATVLFLFIMSSFVYIIMMIQVDHTPVDQLNASIGMVVSVVLGGLLLPWWGGLFWAVINLMAVLSMPAVNPGIDLGTITATWTMILVLAGLVLIITRNRDQQEQDRRKEILHVNLELLDLKDSLETRVQSASRELSLAAEVGQNILLVRDLDILLTDAVELIRETFDLYYAQIYLTDNTGRNLVLRAGTGDVGKRLINQGHRLAFSLTSITGTAAVKREAAIVEDTATSAMHQPNPLLPETCAEIAVPMMVGERVVGVMDIQSNQPGLLSQESLPAFESLAGQLAVALINIELFAQAEQARQQVEEQAKIMSRQGWDEFLDGIERPERLGFLYQEDVLQPLTEVEDVELEGNALTQPIRAAGEEIGTIQLESDQEWSLDDQELVDNIAQQVALRLENLRLLAQSQQYQQEAEEALRRLTREGWTSYQAAAGLGFIHSNQQVKPLSPERADLENALTFDFKVSDEPIGKLGILGADHLPDEDKVFVAEVQEQLSVHIEALRLQDQTQQALADTEELYQGSERIVRADSIQNVLEALIESTMLSDLNRVGLMMFDRPRMEGEPPETLTLIASWDPTGESEWAPVGTRYKAAEYPLANLFSVQEASFVEDITRDERFNNQAIEIFARQLGTMGMITLPLIVGDQSIGAIVAMSNTTLEVSDEDERKLTGLVDQAATVIMSQRLYDQAQKRAQREQKLREISEAVRAAVDPETILRKAAREVGAVLGRKTVVRLGGVDQLDDSDNGREKI